MNKLLLLADEREGAWPHEKTPKVYSSSERRRREEVEEEGHMAYFWVQS